MDNVVNVLSANADAYQILGHPRVDLLLIRQLLVRGRPWVNSKSLGVTDAERWQISSCVEGLFASAVPARQDMTYFARLDISLKPSTT